MQENHADDIWNTPVTSTTRIAFPGETHELGLGPRWAEEYLEHSIDNAEVAGKSSDNAENPNFAYSKFMKFMRQEGDLPVEAGTISPRENLDDKWSSEFTDGRNVPDTASGESNVEDGVLSAVDEELEAAGSWVEEFTKKDANVPGTFSKTPSESLSFYLFIEVDVFTPVPIFLQRYYYFSKTFK